MKIVPSLEEVQRYAASGEYRVLPLSCEMLSDRLTPIECLRILKSVSTHCYLLESAEDRERWGRYTFLGFDPVLDITCLDGEMKAGSVWMHTDDPSAVMRQILSDYKSPSLPGLPPFTGGLVGYFAYDYLSYSEPSVKMDVEDSEHFQDVDVMLFDKVIAFDHFRQKIVLIVNMRLEDGDTGYSKAVLELKQLRELLLSGEDDSYSRIPVYEDSIDNVLGILTTRDFLISQVEGNRAPLRKLIRPAHFVPESVRTDVLFQEMQSRKQHMAIVVDEYGGTSGLITLEDLLEEIVGNIYDEFDPKEEPEITRLSGGRWRISGSAELESVANALDIQLPDDLEYDTLGGLVFSRLTEIPSDGEHPVVECFGLRISVEQIADRRVEWAVVEKLSAQPEDDNRAEKDNKASRIEN